jgi:FkbM family methyltransferase
VPHGNLTPIQRDLLRKLELEAAMLAAPQDAALRASYFDHLGRLAGSHTGLLTATLPELGAPLYFRTGSPDVAVMADVFRDRALEFDMRPTPLRILVIGGYAGYTAVDLARRYPRARVLAAEPMADNFRLLTLNTTPWPRIRAVNVAVWHHADRLNDDMRLQADWAVRLNDEAELADRTVPAATPGELLARAGWDGLDMVVCDASGSEREIFADPLSPWLRHLDAALVRIHEHMAAGAEAAVLAAFDAEQFERRRQGDMALFVRRTPLRALPPAPPELALLRSEPGLTQFAVADVAQNAGAFFVYDGANCQLHPNPPGQRPARVIFAVQLSGQTRFTTTVQHAGRGAAPVTFSAAVGRDNGTLLARGDVTLAAGEAKRLSLTLPALSAPGRVVLQTQMAPEAQNNLWAWARWLDPKLA